MEPGFDALYETFRQPLLRYVRYKTKDADLAEEIVQEVFLKAFRSIDTLEEGVKFRSWLYAIAANVINDHYRKRRPALTDAAESAADSADPTAEEASVLCELDCCLSAMMRALPPSQHDVLQAVYFDEHTLDEYARIQGLNLSTAKSHSRRAKATLKSLLESCCEFRRNSRDETVDFQRR